MAGNIFIHDAVPTWSGFLYQGRIAVYLAVRKICELNVSGNKNEVEHYAIEMERCEDIAVVYEDNGSRQYHSIHQTKNQAESGIGKYKSPLTQLMMEKGFCQKNGYGVPQAYLHVSSRVVINDGKTFEKKMEEWQSEITGFYETLCDLRSELGQGGDTDEILTDLEKRVKGQPILFNRSEYRKKLEETKKSCDKKDCNMAGKHLEELITFLEEKLYIPAIDERVEIYSYDAATDYCSGTDLFFRIVEYVKNYKGRTGKLSEGQYEYIADKMLCFVEGKILERHQRLQEGKEASWSIPLSKFLEILDGGIEKYEEEANILTLIRKYDERMEDYCSVCPEAECLGEACRLQRPDCRRNMLGRDKFVRLCYNLNPECADEITDRACLAELLDGAGMLESVFASLKDIPESCFIETEDKTRFQVRNQENAAFLTAISGGCGNLTVKRIVKAMSVNQDLIENIFDADQLVTVRLEEPSSIWDNSCVRIRKSDLPDDENGEKDEEHSIYVAKKPEFIKAEQLIKEIGKN